MSHMASQVVLVVKNLIASAGDIRDTGLIPGLGRSLGEEHGNLLQYSCLENPRDRGAWQATVDRVTKNRRGLKYLSMHRCPRHPSQQEKSHTKGFSNLLYFHSIISLPFSLCLLYIPLLTTFPLVLHHLAYFLFGCLILFCFGSAFVHQHLKWQPHAGLIFQTWPCIPLGCFPVRPSSFHSHRAGETCLSSAQG